MKRQENKSLQPIPLFLNHFMSPQNPESHDTQGVGDSRIDFWQGQLLPCTVNSTFYHHRKKMRRLRTISRHRLPPHLLVPPDQLQSDCTISSAIPSTTGKHLQSGSHQPHLMTAPAIALSARPDDIMTLYPTCHKTVFVMDHGPYFALPCQQVSKLCLVRTHASSADISSSQHSDKRHFYLLI